MGIMNVDTTLAKNAAGFNAQLMKLVVALDRDISQVIRKTVFDVFKNIVYRSPVKTGAYRASHCISTYSPNTQEGISPGTGGSAELAIQKAISNTRGFSSEWTISKGTSIFMFNNVPYASYLEEKRAVYALALEEVTIKLEQELAKL